MTNTKKTKIISIDTEKLLAGATYEFREFSLRLDGLYVSKVDKKTEEVITYKVCDPLFVKKTVQNLDNKDVYLILCYWFKGKFHEIKIGKEQLAPNELIKLGGKGVDISHENVRLVSTSLIEQLKYAPHQENYREVGWHENEDGVLVFRHHQELPRMENGNACNDTVGSSYDLEPKGSLNAWKGLVFTEISPYLPLQFLLCISFSAPLVGYLSRIFNYVDNLFIHLVGDSTKGKTSSAMVVVSAFGKPSDKEKGLIKTWNGTVNANINKMAGNYGIPIVLDELSMSNSTSMTEAVYIITNGQEKSRLNDEMKQRKQGTWATTILSTGEQSIFERTNQNVGLTVRLFEYKDIKWTSSAENADEIRNVFQENYGHAGQEFINYIIKQGLSIMEEKWLYWKEQCIDALPDSPFRTRIATKYAIILAAGDIANDALGLMLDLEGILAFIVKDEEKKLFSRDIGAKALNKITELFIQYQANFRREGDYYSPNNCWGKVFFHSDCIEVAFLKNVMEQQLRLGGFDDPKVVVRDWKEKGWLVTEGDRATKRTRIFENSEQAERKKALGSSVPQKLQDTTYNIKLPLDTLKGLINQQASPLYLAENSNELSF
jgi:putative DNA primase/helicase